MAFTIPPMLNGFLGNMEAFIPKAINTLIIIVIGYIAIKILVKIVAKFFDKVDFDRAAETFIENVIKVALWAILIVIILSNLDVDVSGIIAGLGIMGFIVGFALKDTLGNLASGIFILFHKPFRVGDFVEVASIKGTVQSIGIAACIIHTFENQKVTLPNSIIWGSPITNFTGLEHRKMELIFGIGYEDNMDKAIKIIDNVLKKDKRVLADPEPQIIVKELADSSVNISVRVCAENDVFMDLKWDLTKKVKEEFDKNKISIPYPQSDVHMKKK
ncbi:MAG: mechanosensitive ion channel family protein [Nanoarchaeota archaeon]|nr:mechanosensitive ion channel family protein [Nanoarchaeota archaeon]